MRKKALLTFSLHPEPSRNPGALSQSLSVFGKQGFNLTSVNARPSRQRAWDYNWVIEVELGDWSPTGTYRQDDGEEGKDDAESAESKLEEAVKQLKRTVAKCSNSGVWSYSEADIA